MSTKDKIVDDFELIFRKSVATLVVVVVMEVVDLDRLDTEVDMAVEQVDTESDTVELLPSHSRRPTRLKLHRTPNTLLLHRLLSKQRARWPLRPLRPPSRPRPS